MVRTATRTGTGTRAILKQIAEERERVRGRQERPEDEMVLGQLSLAAACYAMPLGIREALTRRPDDVPDDWPFDAEGWHPDPEDRIAELVKAGAYLVAEIERLQRRRDGHGGSIRRLRRDGSVVHCG